MPQPLQIVSYVFPLTYGIDAGRRAIGGATFIDVAPLLGQMITVGLISILLG